MQLESHDQTHYLEGKRLIVTTELECYSLSIGPSQRNVPLYFTYVGYPIYTFATILACLDGLELIYAALHFLVIFITEWFMRNFILYQRPGYVCIEKDKLILWYLSGIVRVDYSSDRFQVIKNYKDGYIVVRIKRRILPFKIHPNRYDQIDDMPRTLDIIKLRKR